MVMASVAVAIDASQGITTSKPPRTLDRGGLVDEGLLEDHGIRDAHLAAVKGDQHGPRGYSAT